MTWSNFWLGPKFLEGLDPFGAEKFLGPIFCLFEADFIFCFSVSWSGMILVSDDFGNKKNRKNLL
jgi:hypothetical protein